MARDYGLRSLPNRGLCVYNRSSHLALCWKEQHSALGIELVAFNVSRAPSLGCPYIHTAGLVTLDHSCDTVQG